MQFVRSIVAAVCLMAPLAAWAADVPVTFTTKEKDLKLAVAGTSLTFALYGDSACATQVYTTPVLIENVALITKIKQFTPKNDTKLPNTVALQHTLTGVTAHGNLYLKVTGTGIVPVAGACQAQAATVPTPTCNDGIQNQNESDVDCGGGNCVLCQLGDSCVIDGDCGTANCQAGICGPAAASCFDGIQNQDETDIDCGGGICAGQPCGEGQQCLVPSDCQSSDCQGGICQAAPDCGDGILNGDETDVDCGGPMCGPTCMIGQMCTDDSDCDFPNCLAGFCAP